MALSLLYIWISVILEASIFEPDQNPIGLFDFLAYIPMPKNIMAQSKDITHMIISPTMTDILLVKFIFTVKMIIP